MYSFGFGNGHILLLSRNDYYRLKAMLEVRGCLKIQTSGYAQYQWYPFRGAKKRQKSVHIMIAEWANMDVSKTIDHRDGNRLNCCRRNLRPATRSQQRQNSVHASRYGYKGIFFNQRPVTKPWEAKIGIGGRVIWLGAFTTKVQAARAYDRAAKRHFGQFAKLNFSAA